MSEFGDSLERWWTQHSELDHLVESLEKAIAEGPISRAAEALKELDEALEAHFAVEESSYFPLIERFSPPHAYAVRAARLSHTRIRESLNDLHELTETSRLVEARRALSLLLDRFRRHEAEETKLIGKLATLAGAPND